MKMRVGIIGGGITGLTSAYELSKRNIEAHVFESSHETGGIAGTVSIDGMVLEKYYHHFFKSDKYIIKLINELGLEKELSWFKSRMGFFAEDALYDFGTPISLLKFKPLPFIDKIRFGMAVLKILENDDYKELEKYTAKEWIIKNAGMRVYDTVWKPLLLTKFGDDYSNISMSWLWGKIKLRGTSKEKGKEVLGYINGSIKRLLDRLEEELKKNGAKIMTECAVESIKKRDGFVLKTSKGEYNSDRVICTAPLPIFLNIGREVLPPQYIEEKRKIEYTAVVCMILFLDRPFTKYYWLNIGDGKIPFGGLIEHTNLLNKELYGNNHILYISNYLYKDSPCYCMGEYELLSQYMPHLRKINPGFNEDWVKKILVFKDEYAQPVIKRNYSKIIPGFKTPVEGLYTASMCNIYPEDRGVNYGIRDGIMVSKHIAIESEDI